jgi:hypothetical protein
MDWVLSQEWTFSKGCLAFSCCQVSKQTKRSSSSDQVQIKMRDSWPLQKGKKYRRGLVDAFIPSGTTRKRRQCRRVQSAIGSPEYPLHNHDNGFCLL